MELKPEFYQDRDLLLKEHPMSAKEAPSPAFVQAYVDFARRWPMEVAISIAAVSYSLAGAQPSSKLVVRNPWIPRLVAKLWRGGRAKFADMSDLAETLATAIQQDSDKRLAEGASIAGVLLSGMEGKGTPFSRAEARAMADLAAWKAYKFASR